MKGGIAGSYVSSYYCVKIHILSQLSLKKAFDSVEWSFLYRMALKK